VPRKPYNPASPEPIPDRQATDLLRNARVAPMDVDDPWEPGSKITVARSLRDDPLARLHVRDQIDDAQYHAGRRFQRDFEAAERGPRAIDPSKEAVDGGRTPEPITEHQHAAALRLAKVREKLGHNGMALVISVLVHGQHFAQIAERRGVSGERWERYYGMAFQECLNSLAVFYDLAMEPKS
jgi:Domain of unknown function (DUF6456)